MMIPPMFDIAVTINGVRRQMAVGTEVVLADLLRDKIGLKGCKVACDAGVCGACTVLVSGQPTAACCTLAFEADGQEVTTIEGIGDASELHLLQRIFLEGDAFQCGFCTSGMILTVKALLDANPDPDEATIRDWLNGNLCRCTGYQMIVEAVQAAAAEMRKQHAHKAGA